MKNLPKLYVIGDSISIHYGPYLESYLKGHLEYSRKKGFEETFLNLDDPQGDSSGDSSAVLSFLKAKTRSGGIDADFLLLNCGLHDIKTDPRTGRKQVTLSQYEQNLRAIVRTVGNSRPKLVWIRTTLFDDAIHNRSDVGFYRYAADCIEYNQVADRVMEENGIPVIDLCTFTLYLELDLYCDHVHFTEVVRKKQAAYIARWLTERLGCTERCVSQSISNIRINKEPSSISVVICCYNSETRLSETLRHLLEQEVPEGISWEVIVVDNASTDNTAQVARSLWPDDAPAPMRVVSEPEPGLSHARKRGLSEAQYKIVSFLDDDNWAAPNWIRLVSEIMATHPEVGACGGRTEAVFEKVPPSWFADYASSYVVGRQGDKVGDVTWSRGWLWGAGLTVRKKAWCKLVENGFQPTLSGRSGKKISSGEDVEICYALRLAGWRLWYSDELVLQHFIPAERMTIKYLSKLKIGFGAQTTGFNPYQFYVWRQPSEVKPLFGRIWLRQLLNEIYIAMVRDLSLWSAIPGRSKAKNSLHRRMQWLVHQGRIAALWNGRKNYDHQVTSFDQNRWIGIARQTANYLHWKPDFGDAGNRELSSNPLVTALICNYNYGRFLAQAIDSALAQTWRNLEVIVVDDGSTDESREILGKYKGRIRTILKENGGQASAFNAGIAAAQGEIICFLDSDDFWRPDKIETVIAMYRHAKWGLVCDRLIEFDNSLYDPNLDRFPTGNVNANYVHAGDALEYSREHGYGWVFQPTSAMSMPTKIARLLWPLPERNWRICADNPLAMGAVCHALAGVIDKPLGYYRFHGKNGFASDQITNYSKYFARSMLTSIQSYLYLIDHLGSNSERLNKSPDFFYPGFRSKVLTLSPNPAHRLFDLYRTNVKFHLESRDGLIASLYNIVKWIIVDTLLIIALAMGFPINRKKLRIAAREMLASEDESLKSFCKRY